MEKEELLDELDHAMTVGALIKKLERFDKNMIVINGKDKDGLPIYDVSKTNISYCYDEIIRREVIEIW